MFRDAKRPGEDLVPAGLDANLFGTVGHANSDRQGTMIFCLNSLPNNTILDLSKLSASVVVGCIGV